MKKVYLAGPMRGLPEQNYPAFKAAREALRAQGYIVFCPAEYAEKTEGPPCAHANSSQEFRRRVLAADLAWICAEADAIAMLPGWRDSAGATAERAVAVALGLEIMDLGDVAPQGSWREKVEAEVARIGRKLTLDELLVLAKDHFMTPAEVAAQRASWARSCLTDDASEVKP